MLLWLGRVRKRYLDRIATLDDAILADRAGLEAQSDSAMVAALAESDEDAAALVATLTQEFESAAQSAAEEAAQALDLDPNDFDLADAFTQAGDRAPELLGLQRVADQLMPLGGGVESTTSNLVRQTVQSSDPGIGLDGLIAVLSASFAFSAARAAMVARTEILRASNAGALALFAASGLVAGTAWETEGDDRVDGECWANEAVDFVPLGGVYPSGHLAPPAHPNCRCSLIPMSGPPGE